VTAMAQGRAALAADAVRVVLALATLTSLVLGDVEATLTFALVALPAIAVRFVGAPPLADLCFVALAGLDAALHVAGAFQDFNRNDTFGHFVLPAAVAPIVWTALRRAGVRIEAARPWIATATAQVLVVAVIVALGAVWELVEWGCDVLFGTDLSPGYTDMVHDLGMDTAGATLGALLFVRARPPAPPAAGDEDRVAFLQDAPRERV
jgi:uncharacterized membrane protein YjdF